MAESFYRAPLERAFSNAIDYLDALDAAPVGATATLEELRARLARPLAQDGLDAAKVIDELVKDTAGGILGSTGGRFFAWVIGGSIPAALAADWLTSTWDQNAALHACGPAEAVIEEVCGEWLKDLLGLPKAASFGLVTGCQMAHFTCLAAARNALLARRGWNVERKGLAGAPQIRVVSGSHRHGTFERALRFLGLGSDSIIDVPLDGEGRVREDSLAAALGQADDVPTIVLLQAGDINLGAYDRFDSLVPLAHSHDAWVHVDGAFGLWVAACPSRRHLVAGAAGADSWATDGHKWLNVPYDCGYAFVKDPAAHEASMSMRASYLVTAEEARDQVDWNPELSRRGRGVATYAAIRQLGRTGVADLIERTCRRAHELVTRIGALPGAEMVWEPSINQGLVRFLDPRKGAIESDHDRRTDKVIQAIVTTGEAFFGGTTWSGKRCMRVSVCNWRTSTSDVDRVVAAVRSVLESMS
ncbi:MAG TPA: pyridoxal-dependent decarboxylase [Spirochaetia bacterium]|nr:pyridoxal-dependent decarboxylase [Spirochaetia bacterium]